MMFVCFFGSNFMIEVGQWLYICNETFDYELPEKEPKVEYPRIWIHNEEHAVKLEQKLTVVRHYYANTS